jgi:hypothetical protein
MRVLAMRKLRYHDFFAVVPKPRTRRSEQAKAARAGKKSDVSVKTTDTLKKDTRKEVAKEFNLGGTECEKGRLN